MSYQKNRTEENQEQRYLNKKRRDDATRRLGRSRLPSQVKSTLSLIISGIGSPTDYELSWPSQGYIGKKTGKERRAIERHVRAILASGIIKARSLGSKEANKMMKEKYGVEPKKKLFHYAHYLNFYEIANHPFWSESDDMAEEDVLAKIKKALERRSGPNKKPLVDGIQKSANTVHVDVLNTVHVDGQSFLRNQTSDESTFDQLRMTKESSFEESLPGKPEPGRDSSNELSVECDEFIYHLSPHLKKLILAVNERVDMKPSHSDPIKLAAVIEEVFEPYPLMNSDVVIQILNSDFNGLRERGWGTITHVETFMARFKRSLKKKYYEMKEQARPDLTPIQKFHKVKNLIEIGDLKDKNYGIKLCSQQYDQHPRWLVLLMIAMDDSTIKESAKFCLEELLARTMAPIPHNVELSLRRRGVDSDLINSIQSLAKIEEKVIPY